MKSNRTKIFLLLSIPLICLVAIMAKKDFAPLTFRPNSTTKQYQEVKPADPLSIDKIPYLDFMRMLAKYRDERQEVINEHFNGLGAGQYGAGFEDSRYYYISLQTLENYIAYIKQQIHVNEVNVQFSGIRIYPIVYPNTGSNAYFSSIPSIYRNHQSIVFTPTYMDTSGYAIDFDPDLYMANPVGSGNVPKRLVMTENQSAASFLTAAFGSGIIGGAISAQDHTWLCPPPLCVASALSNADIICPDSNSCPY